VLLVLLLSMVSLYYNGHTIQFCSPDSSSSSTCILCPEHGTCNQGVLQCDDGFVRYGVQCVEDPELNKMAESIAEAINVLLMDARGKYQCGETEHYSLTTFELQDALNKTGRYPHDKMGLAFNKALDIMIADPTSFNLTIEDGGNRFSTNKMLLSLSCMAKLALYGYLPHLVAIVAGVGAVLVGRFWHRKKAHRTQEVQNLASMVLLELQAKRESARGGGDHGIVVDHLRDKLLHGRREKDKYSLWRRVQALVQADSRVGEYASWKNGEQVTSWEWRMDQTPQYMENAK